MHRKGFTLIELLVVIGIIAILAVVTLVLINPAQLFAQGRDSNRLSSLLTLNSAISLYTQTVKGGYLGTSSVVYVSIPDPSLAGSAADQCQGLSFQALPAPWIYHCASSSTVRSITGTGWLPVALNTIPGGSPIGSLPLDPTNTSSTGLYYTYTTDGTNYELTASMESQKYDLGGSNDAVSTDGGTKASLYEVGDSLTLEPLDYGMPSLVGYWTLGEGTGTVAYDYSGNNATGTWNGVAAGTSGYYSSGIGGSGYAGAFNGTNDYVANAGGNSAFNLTSGVTLMAWIKLNASSTDEKIISKRPSYQLAVYSNNVPETEIFIASSSEDTRSVSGGTVLQNGVWYQIAGTYNGSVLTTYVDGTLDRQLSVSGSMATTSYVLDIGKAADSSGNYFNGLIENARVYNTALSAAQILAIYKAQN
jgi:prepilin-type N-terminal cleavage/methylation domain-containing protein